MAVPNRLLRILFLVGVSLLSVSEPACGQAPAAPTEQGGSRPDEASTRPGEANAEGVYQVGCAVRPPSVTKQVDPPYPKKVRHLRITGDVGVGLIVDRDGLPQNVHLLNRLQPDLDAMALEAVRKYRF